MPESASPESALRGLVDSATVSGYKLGSLLSKTVPSALTGPLGSVLGLPAALSMRSRRGMVDRHMRRLHPGAKPWEIRRLTQAVFDSYARYYVESFRLPVLSKRQVAASFSIEGFDEHVVSALDRGTGAIIALPHLGGWEWAGRWVADQGHRLAVVVEPLEPVELFDWFVDLRRQFGMKVIPLGPNAGSECVKALRDNQILCLLSDRDLTGTGVPVDFFGERTTLPAGPATLALRCGSPLLSAAVYFSNRTSGHHAVIRPPIDCSREGRLRQDVERITQVLAGELEELIRRAPDQWHLLQPNWPSDPGYGQFIRGNVERFE
jgi:KDO2-lipid IV(A) lauroyltransferase